MNVIGNVKGKTCIIVDDIIDSGGTIVNAAKALKDRGAKDVYVYITHGVLSGEAVDKIKKSVIKNLVITDTIDNQDKIKKLKILKFYQFQALWVRLLKEFLIQRQYLTYLNNYLELLETCVKNLLFMNSLEANTRNTKSKGDVRSLRLNGNIPGIIYGGSEQNEKVSVSKKILKSLNR